MFKELAMSLTPGTELGSYDILHPRIPPASG